MKSIFNKLEEFTNNKVKFVYHWKTRKLKSLFPLKHLLTNPGHTINWQVITSALHQQNKWKILEAYYITKFKPNFNNQLDIKIMHLFRNGIT